MTAVTDPHPVEEAGVPGRPQALGLFGEMGLVGVLVLLASLPLVTCVAALAAGVAHMRRHLLGYGDAVADYAGLFWAALVGSWPLGAGATALGLVTAANVGWLAAGSVPGGGFAVAGSLAVAALAWVVLVRTASAWAGPEGHGQALPVRAWLALAVREATSLPADPVGVALLVVALAVGILLGWMFLPVAVVMPGLWVLAAVGVEYRRRRATS